MSISTTIYKGIMRETRFRAPSIWKLDSVSGNIWGTIDVEIGEYFEAQDLVIEFKGVERSHMGVSS